MFPLLLLRPLLLLLLSSLLSLPSQSSLRVCFYPSVPVGRVRSLSQSKSLTVHRLKSLCARNSCSNCGCFLIFHFFFFTFSLHFVPVLHRLHVFVCEFCRNLVSVCARACVCECCNADNKRNLPVSTFPVASPAVLYPMPLFALPK